MEWKANVNKKEEKKNDHKDDAKPSVIKSDSNHIYFYSDVDHQTCLDLNKHLQDKTDELLSLAQKNDFGRPKIYLHINSYGGYIFSAISTMDTILRLRKMVDIITIVEGSAASSGTLISVTGTERWITPNSYMLIHQLSSGLYGKYRDLKDDMKNSDELMRMIKKTYHQYTAVPESEIDKILDHDLWWDAETCLRYKIVDKIV
jgi:ATP-dependent protease ClpP protease subunit